MVNDVCVYSVGHTTVKSLQVTETTCCSSQAGLGRLVHETLHSIEEIGLLLLGEVTPLFANGHLLLRASASEVIGNIFILVLGCTSVKSRVRCGNGCTGSTSNQARCNTEQRETHGSGSLGPQNVKFSEKCQGIPRQE